MTVVDLKVPKRARRGLPLDQATEAARFFEKMVREIKIDLGGRHQTTRIADELICAFAGAATTLRYLNRQVMLGELSEIDLSGYATIASTMLRIGARLGFHRLAKDVTPSLAQIQAEHDVDEAQP